MNRWSTLTTPAGGGLRRLACELPRRSVMRSSTARRSAVPSQRWEWSHPTSAAGSGAPKPAWPLKYRPRPHRPSLADTLDRMLPKPVQVRRSETIEVSYDPNICSHAAECLRGLPQVFDLQARPWIQPDHAEVDA